MPRKIKTAFTGSDEDRAITGIHDIAFLSRERDGVKGFEVRVGGGTSIMARVAPTALRLRRGRQRRLPEGHRGRASASSTARTGCASTAPAPGSRSWSTRSASTPSASWSTRSCEGDWVAERDFDADWSSACASTTTRRRNAPAAPPAAASPNGDRTEFERFLEGNVQAQRQEGFSTVEVKITRGDLTPEQFRGLGHDHARVHRRLRPQHRAAELRPALGPRRVALRRLAAAGRARPRRGRRPRDHRRRQLPRHRQLQTRDHQLDGPQPGGQGAGRLDADRATS